MTLPATNSSTLEDKGAGQTLGRYELLLPIASGGMAMVWAARLKGTRGFQKIVAIKTILPKLSDDPEFEQMFLDEASLASQIRHPHVVEILDLGEQEGVLYLVMEWIDGVPLNQVIRSAKKSGGVPLPVAVRICMQAAAGLHAAHELRDAAGQLVGLVHRDVSPQNVLVTYDGVAKVVDFGVAKTTAAGGSVTAAGHIKGKVGYMAPEQIRGETLDRRIDVFSLGCVLYYLTTGQHPFRKESDAATMYNVCSSKPAPSPRSLVPSYPVALDRVLTQALAKDPAKRYPSANDLLRALDQALPSNMRASTDEEVAKFLHSLFSERRHEQKTALNAALARADLVSEKEKAEGGGRESQRKLRDLLDSQPPPSAASHSGVSGVAMLASSPTSSIQPAPNLGDFEATGPSVSRVLEYTPDPTDTPPRRRIWPTLLVLVLLATGAVVLYFVVRPRLPFAAEAVTAPDVEALPSPPLPATTQVVDRPLPDAPRDDPGKSPEGDTRRGEPVASSPTAQATPTASEQEKPPPIQTGKPGKHGGSTKPAKPGAPSWKQDPGF